MLSIISNHLSISCVTIEQSQTINGNIHGIIWLKIDIFRHCNLPVPVPVPVPRLGLVFEPAVAAAVAELGAAGSASTALLRPQEEFII